MICSTLTLSSISPLVCSSINALLSRREVTHQHHKAGDFLKTHSFPPKTAVLCANHCFVIPQPVPKQVLPPLTRHPLEVTWKYLIDFSGPHIQFWTAELPDLIISSFHLTTMTMFSRTVTGVSRDSVALGKKQFLSVREGHWYIFLFLYSTGQFYLVLPSSWLPQHVCSADLRNLIVHFIDTVHFR